MLLQQPVLAEQCHDKGLRRRLLRPYPCRSSVACSDSSPQRGEPEKHLLRDVELELRYVFTISVFSTVSRLPNAVGHSKGTLFFINIIPPELKGAGTVDTKHSRQHQLKTQNAPPPADAERGAMLHVGAKYSNRNSKARFPTLKNRVQEFPRALLFVKFFHASLSFGREFDFRARKLITGRRSR